MTMTSHIQHLIAIQLGKMPVIFDHIQNGVLITDASASIIYTNPAFTKITGYSKDEVLGQNPEILHSGNHDIAFYQSIWKKLNKNGFWEGEVWNRRKTGEIYPEYLTISTLELHQSDDHLYIGIFSDISYLKKDIKQKLHLAFYDALTELPNRNLFMDRASSIIEYADGKPVAIFFMDLDHFKLANDKSGHHIGDKLLQLVGERLKSCMRSGDTVARMGGDEFAAILPSVNDKNIATDVAKRIVEKTEKPFVIGDTTINISISIGMSFYPKDALNLETLLIHADKAMYVAKKNGSKIESYDTIKNKI